ncbi:hypothetical protein B0T19DRAFT_454187 [Cercophora scortea]|uniref:Uncharacterized protein n=1 Tax=Cercophora scortea TaxID=314031 RepID=A0AAE0J508_9PEZI|nr:hypothetical protein B0T19DRAFT_454187 [Cercophora scortea]
MCIYTPPENVALHPHCSSPQNKTTAIISPPNQSSNNHTRAPTMLVPLILVSVLTNTAVLAAPGHPSPGGTHHLQAKPQQPGTMAQKLAARLARRWDVYEAYGRYWAYWNPPQREDQPIPTPLPSLPVPLITTSFLPLTGTGLATAPAPPPTAASVSAASASGWTSVLTVTLWPNTTFTPLNAVPTSTETVLVTLLPDRPQTLTLTPPFIVVTVSEEAAPAAAQTTTTVIATPSPVAAPVPAPAPEGQTVTLVETSTLSGASAGVQTFTSLVVVPVSTPASAPTPTAPPVELVTVYEGTITVTVHDLVTVG